GRLYGQEEDADIGVKLLKSIKAIFDKSDADKLFMRTIVEALVANADDEPWPAWFEDSLKHDRPGSAASKLARKLKPYGIKAEQVRIGDETGKGYRRAHFEKVWERMLTAPPPSLQKQETVETWKHSPAITGEQPCFSPIDSTGNVSDATHEVETL